MTFEEKSTLTMTLLLLTVFGGYFALALGPVAASPSRQDAAFGLVIGATVVLAILTTVSHIVLALINRKQASARQDERGRLIALRSERLSGYILAVGMFAGIVLAMLQTETFWIAQALLGAWVLAEVSEGVAKLVLYQRGA
jgi:Na+-transporting NADH:ubiquinone oxidoreductase subunit NqrE